MDLSAGGTIPTGIFHIIYPKEEVFPWMRETAFVKENPRLSKEKILKHMREESEDEDE